MSEEVREVVEVLPLLAALFSSFYVSALLCHRAGMYLDGGRLGWVTLACWTGSSAVFFAVQVLALAILGLLPGGAR